MAESKAKFIEAIGKARQLAEQAVALDPSEAFARSLMGDVLLEQGDPGSAVREHRIAVRLAPEWAVNHHSLGVALKASGDLPKAIEEFQIAARLEPEQAVFHFNLGEALEQSGDLVSALGEYRKFASLEPDSNLASPPIALTLAAMGDWGGAVEEMKKYCQAGLCAGSVLTGDPSLAALLDLVARFKNRGDKARVIAAVRMAVRLGPKSARIHTGHAGFLVWPVTGQARWKNIALPSGWNQTMVRLISVWPWL